ncbi:MAG: hypothetical protein JOZ99_00385 [Actinobacteria bacterium]|nr:hypothetical protein [Actinomycetota bacterium]
MNLPSLRLREFPHRGFAVWAALVTPVLAWTAHLVVLTALATYLYEGGSGVTFWMHVTTALTLAPTLVALYLAWRMVRHASEVDESDPGPEGRTRFLGELALLIGAINLMLIVLEEVYVDVLHGVGHG